MTPEERQGLVALLEGHWLQFDLARIEVELAELVERHGETVTVAEVCLLERAAA